LTGADVSYVYNLEYTKVNDQTCGELSGESQFYWLADDPVVSDMAGLNLERDLAWADVIEVVVWLFILLAIETVVRLQSRGVTGGALISTGNALKIFLYLMLIALGVYWATLSHWLYLWDELVWIGGFAAIEMNVSKWRDELLKDKDRLRNEGGPAAICT
jgi:Zn-dependent protease